MFSSGKFQLHSRRRRFAAVITTAVVLVAGTATAQAVGGTEQVVLLVSAAEPQATPGPDCKTSPDAENCETRLAHAVVVGPVYMFIRSSSGVVTKVNYYLNDGVGTTQAYPSTSNPYVLNASLPQKTCPAVPVTGSGMADAPVAPTTPTDTTGTATPTTDTGMTTTTVAPVPTATPGTTGTTPAAGTWTLTGSGTWTLSGTGPLPFTPTGPITATTGNGTTGTVNTDSTGTTGTMTGTATPATASPNGEVALMKRRANATADSPAMPTTGVAGDPTMTDPTTTAGTTAIEPIPGTTAGTTDPMAGTTTADPTAGTTTADPMGGTTTTTQATNTGIDSTKLCDGTNTILAEVTAGGKIYDLFARFTVQNKSAVESAAAMKRGTGTVRPQRNAAVQNSGKASGTATVKASRTPKSLAFSNISTKSVVNEMDTLNNFYVYDKEGDFGNKSPSNVIAASGIITISGKTDGTTGGIAHNYGQKYGRWDSRVRISGEEGCWRPNILLWPDEENYPIGGEIDYAESGGNFDAIDMFLHYGAENNQVTGHTKVDARQWTTYSVEWTPTYIAAFVNGKKFFEERDTKKFPPGPMHQTFQLDAQHSNTTCYKNTQMEIDSLRVTSI